MDLQDIIKVWFYKTSHTKHWLLDGMQFIAKEPRTQKGYIFINHDHVEFMGWNQYNAKLSMMGIIDGIPRAFLKAADPNFFNDLDKLLTDSLL